MTVIDLPFNVPFEVRYITKPAKITMTFSGVPRIEIREDIRNCVCSVCFKHWGGTLYSDGFQREPREAKEHV